eukprot:1976563-Pyramimonas_sp.AAC.1
MRIRKTASYHRGCAAISATGAPAHGPAALAASGSARKGSNSAPVAAGLRLRSVALAGLGAAGGRAAAEEEEGGERAWLAGGANSQRSASS